MMGRRKVNHVHDYFEKKDENSKCLVCEKEIMGHHGTNMLKHLKKHKDVYELVIDKNASRSEEDADFPSSSSKKHKAETTTAAVLRECVNLTTVHGRPFALIDDQAFQNIIAMIPSQSTQVVKSNKVKDCVSKTASEMRRDLGLEIEKKLISVKVDAATLGTRCFLGINIQYGLDGKVMIRNLGVIELYARHTSEYLVENVICTLDRYKLGIDQIYCCTTDNGANMLKMTKILQDKLITHLNDSVGDVDTSLSYEDTDSADVTIECELYEDDIDSETFQDNFDAALASSLQQGNLTIPTVRCAAHTLQLAVRDACNDYDTQEIIKCVRNLVKKLRTQNYAMFLRASNKHKPFLDCPTRWGSTFDMVERFLTLKEVISGEPSNDLFFTPEKWPHLEEFLKSLKPSRILTKVLQSEQLSMSDFYGYWLKCELETNEINTRLSEKIVIHMRERQQTLFKNNAFLGAIYMDPRFNAILTSDQKKAAREHLIGTYLRMRLLENTNLHEDKENDNPSTPAVAESHDMSDSSQINSASTATTADKMRHFITQKYLENQDSISTATRNLTDHLKDSLKSFLREPLLDYSENIFEYWETKKLTYPILYQLSQIVLSAPATQVSVERLFSSLKFVMSNLRMSLKDHRVDDILFIRNNSLKN